MAWPVLTNPPVGDPVLASMAQPGYKTWHVEPRTSTNDPRTVITRASDFATWGGSGFVARPHYSRRSMWNADGSLMLVEYLDSNMSTIGGGVPLLNGNTFDYIKRVSAFGSYDFRWHPSNPDLVIYPSGNTYRAYSISTDSSSVFLTFSGYGSVDGGGLGMFGDEGAPSRDGRYWIGCCPVSGGWDLVCMDTVTGTSLGTIQVPDSVAIQTQLNWWTVSRKGGYIVTQTIESPWTTRNGISVPLGLNVWSKSGTLLRTFTGSGYAFHMDMGTDVNGNEVAVILGDNGFDSSGRKIRAIKSWRLDGSTGQTPRVEDGGGDIFRDNWHVSCPMNIDGWAFFSSFGWTDSTSIPKEAAGWNHIIAVRIDGQGKIAVIANVRHADGDDDSLSGIRYFYETHASAHPNGTAVAWTSPWRYTTAFSRTASHLYVAKAEGESTTPPPPDPDPEPEPEPPPTAVPSVGKWFPLLTGGSNTWTAQGVSNSEPTAGLLTWFHKKRGSAMLIKRNESTEAYRTVYLQAVNTADNTPYTSALSGSDIMISKAGAAEAASTGTATHQGGGTYKYVMAAAEVDTLGPVKIRLAKTGVYPLFESVQIVAVDPNNANSMGMAYVDAPVTSRLADEDYETTDDVLDKTSTVEAGLTLRGFYRLAAAVLFGKVSGAGTGTEVFRNAVADTKSRVTSVVDTAGNRTTVTTDQT